MVMTALLDKINNSVSPMTKDRVSRLVFGGKFVLCVMLIVLKYLVPSFSDYVLGGLITVLISARLVENLKIETPWFTIIGGDYVKSQETKPVANSTTPPAVGQ